MTKDTIAQKYCYDDWNSMIKSISDFGMDEQKFLDVMKTYSTMIIIQARKQFAQDVIDDCELNYSEYAGT